MRTFTMVICLMVCVACGNPFDTLPNVVVKIHNVELMLCSTEDSRDWEDFYYLAVVNNYDGIPHWWQLKEVDEHNVEIGQPIKRSFLFGHAKDVQYNNLHIAGGSRLFMLVECQADTFDWYPCPDGNGFFTANDADGESDPVAVEGIVIDLDEPGNDGELATVEYTDDQGEIRALVARMVYQPRTTTVNARCSQLIH